MAVGQNLVPLVNIKIAGKWMFIPLKMVLIGIDPYPNKNDGGDNQSRYSQSPATQSTIWVCHGIYPERVFIDREHGGFLK